MSSAANPASAAASQSSETAPRRVPSAREIHYLGTGVVILGVVLLIVAVVVSLAWTAPPAGPCYPSGGGYSIPCPSVQLTPDELFTALSLEIASFGSLLLGTVLVMSAYFRLNPTA